MICPLLSAVGVALGKPPSPCLGASCMLFVSTTGWSLPEGHVGGWCGLSTPGAMRDRLFGPFDLGGSEASADRPNSPHAPDPTPPSTSEQVAPPEVVRPIYHLELDIASNPGVQGGSLEMPLEERARRVADLLGDFSAGVSISTPEVVGTCVMWRCAGAVAVLHAANRARRGLPNGKSLRWTLRNAAPQSPAIVVSVAHAELVLSLSSLDPA